MEPHAPTPADMWKAGRSWATYALVDYEEDQQRVHEAGVELRKRLRHRNGLVTRWITSGLHCAFQELAKSPMALMTKRRRSSRGEFIHANFGNLPLQAVELWTSDGKTRKWSQYRNLVQGVTNKTIEEVVEVEWNAVGDVMIVPMQYHLPLTSTIAHEFRELWSELAFNPQKAEVLQMHRGLDDPHHVFTVHGDSGVVRHSWSTLNEDVNTTASNMTVAEAVARGLCGSRRITYYRTYAQVGWATKVEINTEATEVVPGLPCKNKYYCGRA
ncbi:uncharacterized protein KRP23_1152 [Phytophthora ramorum]|uniref:uncharacterized protein n=1 Tax=Phytophthora ramorum TaxID=164328 RepID=UPI0030AC5BBE|nr:hypothetical protein KRP23_1152 [Phytophthora ramorum]